MAGPGPGYIATCMQNQQTGAVQNPCSGTKFCQRVLQKSLKELKKSLSGPGAEMLAQFLWIPKGRQKCDKKATRFGLL